MNNLTADEILKLFVGAWDASPSRRKKKPKDKRKTKLPPPTNTKA